VAATHLYRHAQFGTPIAVATLIGLAVATAVVISLSQSTRDAVPWMIVALYAVLVVGYLLFHRLVVTVDEDRVRAAFGIGWIAKEVPLADIVSTEVVRTRRLWGWGIHWTPAGWLYNVGGRQAVRLVLVAERPVMIGSDEPEALKAAVEAARSRGRR
jgi:hypothetical protein